MDVAVIESLSHNIVAKFLLPINIYWHIRKNISLGMRTAEDEAIK